MADVEISMLLEYTAKKWEEHERELLLSMSGSDPEILENWLTLQRLYLENLRLQLDVLEKTAKDKRN